MHRQTIQPAATPQADFDSLPHRQRRLYAYLRTNGARAPGSPANCLALRELFDDHEAVVADLEALIDAGWARAVGNTETGVVHGYDIPEADRETTPPLLARQTAERTERVDWWDYERGRPKPSDSGV